MSAILKPTLGSQLNLGHRLSQGLIGYWLFNEGSGNKVFDLSGYRNDGAIYGNPVWTGGKFGSVLKFDGNEDYYKVLYSPTIYPIGNTDSTVSIWVKANAYTSTYSPLIFKAHSDLTVSDSDYEWVLRVYSNALQLRYWVGTVGTTRELLANLSTGEDHHLVLVFKGSNAYFYHNGVFVTSVVIGNINDANGDVFFGAYSSGGTNLDSWWTGILDIPIFYNRILSASEIAELYLRPFAMFDRMPIELWVGATSVGVAPGVTMAAHYYRHLLQGVA